MTWLLILTLSSGLSGPVEMPEEICKLTAARIAAGEPVYVELEGGAVEQVVEAECKQEVGA